MVKFDDKLTVKEVNGNLEITGEYSDPCTTKRFTGLSYAILRYGTQGKDLSEVRIENILSDYYENGYQLNFMDQEIEGLLEIEICILKHHEGMGSYGGDLIGSDCNEEYLLRREKGTNDFVVKWRQHEGQDWSFVEKVKEISGSICGDVLEINGKFYEPMNGETGVIITLFNGVGGEIGNDIKDNYYYDRTSEHVEFNKSVDDSKNASDLPGRDRFKITILGMIQKCDGKIVESIDLIFENNNHEVVKLKKNEVSDLFEQI